MVLASGVLRGVADWQPLAPSAAACACWPEVHAVIFIRDNVALLLVTILLLVPPFLILKIHKNDQLSLIAQTACMDLAAQENPFAPLGHT